ncbi:group III truncated hemoglobin [Azospirillum sp. A39]|uniref:group III truncated hemoglobin n=1 Tax=Azospirillum sp. A39 TaxID=3462279 RepID=UPI0040455A2D
MPPAVTEDTIAELVDRFYARARQDPLLAPIFAAAVADWDEHLAVIRGYWVRHLLAGPHGRGQGHGQGGGGGGMFMAHAVLPLEPAHFDRWLALFRETAEAILPPDVAEQAMAQAEHAAASLKAGMFTVPGHRFGAPPG